MAGSASGYTKNWKTHLPETSWLGDVNTLARLAGVNALSAHGVSTVDAHAVDLVSVLRLE